jgi:hypothetical protein
MDRITPPEPGAPLLEDQASATPAALSDTLDADEVPTSFGVFKPVGWLMLGFPMQAQADVVVGALHGAGWSAAELLHFKPRESVAELEAMVDKAGAMAGFGYEITLLRRYLALAREGTCWLLVKVRDVEHAASAAAVARECGAQLAVHYRMLTVEELI